MAGVVEEMRVDVEGDRDSGVAHDPADLGDVEAEVDNQVAGEGVAEVVEAQWWPVVSVQVGHVGRPLEHALGDVALALRGATGGREDPVCGCHKGRSLLVGSEQTGELFDQWDLADRGRRLRRHPPRWLVAVGARELRSDVDQPGAEVDVAPDHSQQLGNSQAAIEGGGDEQPTGRRAGAQQALNLIPSEYPLAAATWSRPLPGLELVDRVAADPVVATGVAKDAVQGGEGVGR